MISGKKLTLRAGNTDFQQRHNRMWRMFRWVMGIAAALTLAILIGGAVLAYKAVGIAVAQDWSGGLKPVLERIWCGQPGC